MCALTLLALTAPHAYAQIPTGLTLSDSHQGKRTGFAYKCLEADSGKKEWRAIYDAENAKFIALRNSYDPDRQMWLDFAVASSYGFIDGYITASKKTLTEMCDELKVSWDKI